MLKFIIIVLSVFFLLRAFSRMFVIKTFNSMNQRMQDEMNRRGGSNSQQMPEGSITIDPSVQKQQKSKGQNDDGDYVDYEEVK